MFSSRIILIRFFLLCLLFSFSFSCAGRYMSDAIIAPDAEILNNQANQEIVEVIVRYEDAMERMDLDALFSLLSEDYYENAGTTDTADDDYGYASITEKFQTLEQHVEDVRIDVSIRNVEVVGDRADVLYEFALTMLYGIGGESHWETYRDVNRIQMQREEESWRIISGL